MTYSRAPERPVDMFCTDTKTNTVYIDDRVGLSKLGPIFKVAKNRGMGEHFTVIRVPAAQLRRLVALRRNKEPVSRNGADDSSKPTPPGYIPAGQLTNAQRRERFKIGFAPLRDWWPVS